MSIPHLHLAISHAPLFAALIGFVILLIAVARRSLEMRWVAYGLFVAAALTGIPVFLSGEGSEEAIERLPGVSEALIDAHAAAAKVSLIGLELLGVLSLIAMGLERVRQLVPVPLVAAVLLAGGIETASLGYTANLGGQIRHSEVRAVGSGANNVSDKADANKRGRSAESGKPDSDKDWFRERFPARTGMPVRSMTPSTRMFSATVYRAGILSLPQLKIVRYGLKRWT